MSSGPEITTMGKKGQVVVPKAIRERLGLGPQTKFVVYSSGDMVVMKKIDMMDVQREFERLFKIMDEKNLGLTEEEVLEEIQAMRKERRAKAKDGTKNRS